MGGHVDIGVGVAEEQISGFLFDGVHGIDDKVTLKWEVLVLFPQTYFSM